MSFGPAAHRCKNVQAGREKDLQRHHSHINLLRMADYENGAGMDSTLSQYKNEYMKKLAEKRGHDFIVEIAHILARMELKFERQLNMIKIFQDMNSRLNAINEFIDDDDSNYSDTIMFGADNIVLTCSGLHQIEYAEDGSIYRWTGPDRVTFFTFPLLRRNLAVIQVYLRGFHRPEEQGAPRLFVDGEPIETALSPHEGGYLVAGRIPPRSKNFAAPTEIALGLRKTTKPDGDERLIGAAFLRLEIRPDVCTESSPTAFALESSGGFSA